MKKIDSIVHLDSEIPSIYFPYGKPKDGGTCYFATEECLRNCPCGMVINEHEKYTLKFFEESSSEKITERIINEVGQLAERPRNAKMLQWYPWGDCPPYLTDKIVKIIFIIKSEGIPQYGFTRNKELWDKLPQEDRLNMGLTIDNLSEAKKISKQSGKMTSHPDFKHGYAETIFGGKIVSRCNGWWCITDTETRNSDCNTCLSLGEGCYDR